MRTASFSTPNTPLDLDFSPLPFYCGERNGNPLQYSCLENSMDRGAWRATVHGASKSWTRLSDCHWHSVRCTEQSLLLSVEDKPSHCILEGLPLSLLSTFCLAIISNVSRDQSFLPLHCNGSVGSVEICCIVSHLHKSVPLLAHILCNCCYSISLLPFPAAVPALSVSLFLPPILFNIPSTLSSPSCQQNHSHYSHQIPPSCQIQMESQCLLVPWSCSSIWPRWHSFFFF